MSKFKNSNGASRHCRASGALFKLGAAVVAASAMAATSSAASAQVSVQGYRPSELLVTYKSGTSSAGAHTSNARAGTQGVEAYPLFNTQKVRLPAGMSVAQAIARYSQDPNVAVAQPNYIYRPLVGSGGGRPPVRPTPTPGATPTPPPGTTPGTIVSRIPNDPLFPNQWGPVKVSAPQAWGVTTGSDNIVVAVLDTGVRYNHVDLAANMWRNDRRRTSNGNLVGEIPGNGVDEDKNGYIDDYYGIDGADDDSDPMDEDGHGTHCAGIVGAVSNNGIGIAGINWNVKIMALRFIGEDGGSSADLIQCFQYMIIMKGRGVNVRVASCSFGLDFVAGTAKDPLAKAMFDKAASAGIVSAVAAGNGGADGLGDDNAAVPFFPANYTSPGIISVAASDINDNLARFSNFGSPVALAAPGVDILSTYAFVETQDNSTTPPTIVQRPSTTAYKRLSGTSMAAPHVAGAAALLFAYRPGLSVAQVKRALLNSVDVLPSLTGRVSTNGRLNIYKALRYINPSLPDPGNVLPPDPGDGGGGGGGNPTPTPTPTPTPSATPLVNGNIVFTQQRITNNTYFFATINQIGPQGGAQAILVSGIQELQNPSISLKTGRVAFAVNLANVAADPFSSAVVDRYKFYRNGYFRAATFSFPQNEIFVRNTDGSEIRITNDEANGVVPTDDREPSISPDGTRIVFTKRTVDLNTGVFNDDLYITNAAVDVSRPGAVPQQFKLVGDIGTNVSQESHPSWSPDGTKIVFQSTRGTAADSAAKDSDIYMVSVPTTVTGSTTLAAPVRLTTNPGDDVEPSVGPTRPESLVARPNGQLVYASNRNDGTFEDENYSFNGVDYNFGEDYDIYLQDLSVENGTTNRTQRIVDTRREADLVLGGTGDIPTSYIDPDDPKNDDDDYTVDVAVRGDDRRPSFSADGSQVIFCSDSNFRSPIGFAPKIRDHNPDDDMDIVRVDINSRNFTRLTNERPVRNYNARAKAVDDGSLTVNEDYEPSAGAVVTTDSNTGDGTLSLGLRGTTANNGGIRFAF